MYGFVFCFYLKTKNKTHTISMYSTQPVTYLTGENSRTDLTGENSPYLAAVADSQGQGHCFTHALSSPLSLVFLYPQMAMY